MLGNDLISEEKTYFTTQKHTPLATPSVKEKSALFCHPHHNEGSTNNQNVRQVNSGDYPVLKKAIVTLSRDEKPNSFITRTAKLSNVEKMKKIAFNVNKMFCDQGISGRSSADEASLEIF